MNISYALQTCDRLNNQNIIRYASPNKSEITKKCVFSFLTSVKNVANKFPEHSHNIKIFDDHSSIDTVDFLLKQCNNFTSKNLIIEFIALDTHGIMSSIRNCYEWLKFTESELVYQVQDDYLFIESAIFELIDIFFQLKCARNTESIVIPYNTPTLWNDTYVYTPTPRTIIPGIKRYWIQTYDIPCTFLTSKNQFNKHWDIYEQFLNKSPTDERIEPDTLNKILTTRGVLGLLPISSIALHMQDTICKDPYIDWQTLWNYYDL
jgi:hypothetical protein